MQRLTFQQNTLILDSCCIINLEASGLTGEILRSLPVKVVVTELVLTTEALKIFDGPEGDERASARNIDLTPYLDSNVIEQVSPDNERENDLFLSFAGVLGDDGESVSGALAVARNWAIATDDKKAKNFLSKTYPQIQLVSTPELLYFWAVHNSVPKDKLRQALVDIRRRGLYRPPTSHPLFDWWVMYTGVG